MEKQVIMNGENVREAYEAPKCEMIEMQNEGVLCASGDGFSVGHEGFIDGEYEDVWGR